MNERTGNLVIGGIGLAAVAAFFLPFLDLGGMFAISAWQAVTGEGTSLWMRFVLAMVPLGGLALAASGLTNSRHARWIAASFGIGVLGYLGYSMVRLFLTTTGVGLWLTILAAIGALVASVATSRR